MEQQRTHQIIKELNNNVTNSVSNEVDNLSTLMVWDLPEEVGALDSLTNFSFDGSTFDDSSVRSPETTTVGHSTPISYSQIKLSPTQASISQLLKSSPNSSNVFNFSPSPNKYSTSNQGTPNKSTNAIIGLEVYGKSISPVTASSGRNHKIVETKVSEKSSPTSHSTRILQNSNKLDNMKNLNSAFSPLMDNFRSTEDLNISVESAYHGTPYAVKASPKRSETMMSPFHISPTRVTSNHSAMFDEEMLNDLQAEWFPTGSPLQPLAIK